MKNIMLFSILILSLGLGAQENIIKGDRYALEDKIEKAVESYSSCLKKKEGATAQEKEILTEICHLRKARAYFKEKNWALALENYETISKSSYLWPTSLVERAWIYYKQGDYNRVLGLLATYRSPLLESYFIPEVEVLNALAYFKLCLWDDSFTIVQDFEAQEAKAKELKSWLSKKAYNKITLENLRDDESIPYGRVLWMSLLQKPWINDLSKQRKAVKLFAEKLVEDIESASQDLFNISLELYTKKKTLIYKKERLISERYRGDLSHVHRKATQYFWDFRGEFFADELGDYSFGLKSNCQTVSKGEAYDD